jgi:beta-mannanase
MVSVFRSEGAGNVRWVWCPFSTQPPRRAADGWRAYYPGDRYVDWIGMDGYNWGTTRSWSRWQPFGEIFGPPYRDYAGRKPLMICEVASAEAGGDKGSWIDEMGAELSGRFSKIEAVVWFDAKKETDWCVDSSERALHAFRSLVADGPARR